MAITLYGFGPAWGLPDPSPFVTKTMVQLKMAGLPFEHRRADIRRAPKGKIPYIVDDGVTVSDSTFIRAYLESKYGADFDAGLGPADRAVAWAFEKMLEDQVYFFTVRARWMDDAAFDRGPRDFFKSAPAPLRPLVVALVRRAVRRQLHAQGAGRHSNEEVLALARRSFDALSTQLGDKPYLMGARPCGADAAIFGQILGAACPHFDTPLTALARSYPNLLAYCDRMTAEYRLGI